MSEQPNQNLEQQNPQENTNANNPLGYEKPSKLLRQFAIPSVIAMLVTSLYNIVDQLFIGNSVGYIGNAATSVTFPLITICLAVSFLIGIGGAAKFSLKLGAKKEAEAANCVGYALWLCFAISIIFFVLVFIFMTPLLKFFGATPTVLPYSLAYAKITIFGMPLLIFINVFSQLIRSDGSPTYSMLCILVGAILNLILDPIFIFIFNMGIQGAASATTISVIVSFIITMLYLPRFKNVKITKKIFRFNIKEALQMLSLGLSNCFTQLAVTLVQIITNNSLTYYGYQSIYGSDIPLSAFGIVTKVNVLFISIFGGVIQGAQPIVGFNYGAKQYDRVKKTYGLEIKCNLVVATVAFLSFQFLPRYIISFFGTGDSLYMQFAVKAMRIFLFMTIANSVQITSANFFSAIGKPLKGVILTLSRTIFLFIPVILILPLFIGLDGILFTGPIADFLAFIISVLLIRAEFKKMTLPDVQLQ